MTAPHEPHDPTAAELGSTAQFKAFVQRNDEPDEARERESVDPDAPRAASAQQNRAPADRSNDVRPAADSDDDREIEFSAPAQSGPPVQSLRPEVELPPAELGSTAQFKAFASGEEPGSTDRTGAPHAQSGSAGAERPAPPQRAQSEGLSAPALPPADPSGKRNLLVSLAVVLLVVIVVVLLFILV